MSAASKIAICLILVFQRFHSATVNCNGDCSCPLGTIEGRDQSCTLNCDRADVCKEHVLTCRAGDPCTVRCDAKSSCSSGTIVDGSQATHLTVICNVEDSCKDGIDIRCGTGDCVVECNGKASCENWGQVQVMNAQSFACHGTGCPPEGTVGLPIAFSPSPTTSPTNPTKDPTTDPTIDPTMDPTTDPTNAPSLAPSLAPSKAPTSPPSAAPSYSPSAAPTNAPSYSPSSAPTGAPSLAPSRVPSYSPSAAPTGAPTTSPTAAPSQAPTSIPTEPTRQPTHDPTADPTADPTIDPTADPTADPTSDPTMDPTRDPTMEPTSPTLEPTKSPTRSPTLRPTATPISEVQSAFLLDGSTTTMELSIAITVLALAVCFVCFAIFCLFYARFKLKYGHYNTHHGTREEMESVMSSPVDFKYGMQTIEMESAARPGTTSHKAGNVEIEVPDEAETTDLAETGSLPPSPMPNESPKKRSNRRSRLSGKFKVVKGDKGRRPKYQKVDSEKVDTPNTVDDVEEDDENEMNHGMSHGMKAADGANHHDRNAFDLRGVDAMAVMDSLKIKDVPSASSKPSVSPPSTVSMLKNGISVQDVQPAFYVPGMVPSMLASPPLPPQPNNHRFRNVPKPEHEVDGDVDDEGSRHQEDPKDQGPAFIVSPTITALSEVTASTKVGRHGHMRSVTNLSRGWNDDDEHKTLVTHSVDGDEAE